MNIQKTELSGVLLINPVRFYDHRGFFSETWNRKCMEENGLDIDFVQDNHSLSRDVGTIRGLHFQSPPHAQGKLVRCGKGAFFDVVVDVRKGSPSYGEWIGEELSFENGKQLWLPAGFLHGFVTRESDTEIIYKCTDYYSPGCEGTVRWDSCGIDWGLNGAPILSPKDEVAQTLATFDSPFTFEE